MIDSLAIIDKVLVIAQVCQRERRSMEVSKEGRTDGQTEGRNRRQVIKERHHRREEQAEERIKRNKTGGTTRRSTKKKKMLK